MVEVRFTVFDHEPDLLVNRKRIAWSNLDYVLKQELARRQDWTVYVSGDDYLSLSDVARVIDAGRGLHADVFLLTKRTATSPSR